MWGNAGISPVPGEFHAQRPVTQSFDVFFDLRLNKRLSKQPWGWWFETPSWSLWRQCNALTDQRPMIVIFIPKYGHLLKSRTPYSKIMIRIKVFMVTVRQTVLERLPASDQPIVNRFPNNCYSCSSVASQSQPGCNACLMGSVWKHQKAIVCECRNDLFHIVLLFTN